MNLIYVTTDEVNASLAIAFAARCGLAVRLADPRCRDDSNGVGQVWDLDAPGIGPDWIQELLASGRLRALHSYNLSRKAIRRLREAGVIVARRLSPALFCRLRARNAGLATMLAN